MEYRGFLNLNKQADKLSASGAASGLPALERENNQLKARIAELERLVACDTLTPLFNRRHFMEELDRWCWRAHRYGGEYGLLFVDVDNLKTVNDRLGHQVGDMLLLAIAKALLGAVRRSDLVARIGGDEFAILLDNIPETELAGKAERIAKTIGKLSIDHGGATLTPSISAGFTPLEPGVKPTELLLRADRSMYAAKNAKGIGPLT
jgi:diguanylate cyclase (GGDEF)-like protein